MKIKIDTQGEVAFPTIEGSGRPLADFVHLCHNSSVETAVAEFELADADPMAVDEVLVYCAQRRCADDDATCTGCRLRTRALGLKSLDDFIESHAEVVFEGSDTRIIGRGQKRLAAPSLAHLAQTWSGEEYWYWARRVLRKLRHGIRRAGSNNGPAAPPGQAPVVILIKPQLADNIGMCARAMANFGLDDMRIIEARDGWPNERARVAASGANYVIDAAEPHETVSSAINDLHWVCATTARQRDLRKPIMSPSDAIAEMARRISNGQQCGILFGPEASGMTTEDLASADALVMIPVNNEFASLNLAQAVLIMGYSWILTRHSKSLGRATAHERPIAAGLELGSDRPATKEELAGFFEHFESALDHAGFFNPPERRPTVVHNLRTLFTRSQATAQEVRTLRGIVATLTRPIKRSHNSD